MANSQKTQTSRRQFIRSGVLAAPAAALAERCMDPILGRDQLSRYLREVIRGFEESRLDQTAYLESAD